MKGEYVTNQDYLNNWLIFVEYIVSMFNKGVSEDDISKEFSGCKVSWKGVISEIKLDEEYAPGVSISMAPELTKMKRGKLLRADHLFLNVDEKNKVKWEKFSAGDEITFTARVTKSSGPFPEIQLSEDDEDPEVLLMIGLYECEPQ